MTYQKQTILNSPTRLVEEEDSKEVLFLHSLTFQQSDLLKILASKGDYFCLCFHSMKGFLFPLNKKMEKLYCVKCRKFTETKDVKTKTT